MLHWAWITLHFWRESMIKPCFNTWISMGSSGIMRLKQMMPRYLPEWNGTAKFSKPSRKKCRILRRNIKHSMSQQKRDLNFSSQKTKMETLNFRFPSTLHYLSLPLVESALSQTTILNTTYSLSAISQLGPMLQCSIKDREQNIVAKF